MDIKDLREKIDLVDANITKLFEQRMEIVKEIAEYKQKNGLHTLDKCREEQKLCALQNSVSDENKADIAELFTLIMKQSRERQENIKNGK